MVDCQPGEQQFRVAEAFVDDVARGCHVEEALEQLKGAAVPAIGSRGSLRRSIVNSVV